MSLKNYITKIAFARTDPYVTGQQIQQKTYNFLIILIQAHTHIKKFSFCSDYGENVFDRRDVDFLIIMPLEEDVPHLKCIYQHSSLTILKRSRFRRSDRQPRLWHAKCYMPIESINMYAYITRIYMLDREREIEKNNSASADIEHFAVEGQYIS